MSNRNNDWFFDEEYEEETEYLSIRPSNPKFAFTTPCTRFERLSLQPEADFPLRELQGIELDEYTVCSSPELDSVHPNLKMTMFDSKRVVIQSNCIEDSEEINSPMCLPLSDYDEMMDDDPYDPSNNWILAIYQSFDNEANDCSTSMVESEDDEADDQENIVPENWHSSTSEKKKPFIIDSQERMPLREVFIEGDSRSYEATRFKKRLLSSGKSKSKIMRSLSPPRFSSKHKEKSKR